MGILHLVDGVMRQARPPNDVVVGDARPAGGSFAAIEPRSCVSTANRNAALKSEKGKRVMRNAMLSCALASAVLGCTAFLSEMALAESTESGQAQSVQSEPRLKLA